MSDQIFCPYCGGEMIPQKELRDGYEGFETDPDAFCHYFQCRSCASTSGWSKSQSGAERWARMRVEKASTGTIGQEIIGGIPYINGKPGVWSEDDPIIDSLSHWKCPECHSNLAKDGLICLNACHLSHGLVLKMRKLGGPI